MIFNSFLTSIPSKFQEFTLLHEYEKKFLQILVYLNQFRLILTPRRPKIFQKNSKNLIFFSRKTDKISKNYLNFISRVLELNYHKNSQRYIEFNFDPQKN